LRVIIDKVVNGIAGNVLAGQGGNMTIFDAA
jgi:hypothetical protein